MQRLAEPAHLQAAALVRAHIAHYEEKRDLVTLGAYTPGSDPKLDAALARLHGIERFLQQDTRSQSEFADSVQALLQIA
jgi:flagellar biosynthesis/type III secretory pathway ATPase